MSAFVFSRPDVDSFSFGLLQQNSHEILQESSVISPQQHDAGMSSVKRIRIASNPRATRMNNVVVKKSVINANDG